MDNSDNPCDGLKDRFTYEENISGFEDGALETIQT